MSATNAFENSELLLFFNNTNFALIGDATGVRGSSVAGSLYFGLYTADPGEAGDQTTNEIGYTSYARTAVARSGAGFTVSGNAVAVAGNVAFPAGTGGSGTATHWGLGASVSGAGVLMFKGAISPTIVCGSGITPVLQAGTVVTSD